MADQHFDERTSESSAAGPAVAAGAAALRPEPAWPESSGTTSDAAVDAVMAGLSDLHRIPTVEHAGLYGSIHDDLRRELDAEDDGTAATGTGATGTGATGTGA